MEPFNDSMHTLIEIDLWIGHSESIQNMTSVTQLLISY